MILLLYKAVVDYIVVPHADFLNCAEFKVFTPRDLADKKGQPVMDMIDDRCRLPDHSVLYLRFKAKEIISERIGSLLHNKRRFRKLDETFLDSDSYTCLNSIVELLESGEKTQDSINNCYDSLCALLDKESEKYRPKTKRQSKDSQRKLKIKQPYWNNELQNMWLNLRLAEKHFLKCKDQTLRRALYNTFKSCQSEFDKKLRFYKRRYRRGKALQLDDLRSSHPQQFWREINKLGPRIKKPIPFQLLQKMGSLCFRLIKSWKNGRQISGTCLPITVPVSLMTSF